MILQLLRQFLNNLDRCSASFCFGLSLRFPCPLPKRISSRILSKSTFIPQNHNREYEHAQWKKSPYFGPRWHWACSKSNFTRSHIFSDRVRSGYEIRQKVKNKVTSFDTVQKHQSTLYLCYGLLKEIRLSSCWNAYEWMLRCLAPIPRLLILLNQMSNQS